MNAPILVTGGTGTLGRHVVRRLRESGQAVRVMSRHAHASEAGVEYVVADLGDGSGVAASLEGVETVLHLAGDARHDERTTGTLTAAARQAGVGHLVYISVTAADWIPIGYYRGKAAGERLVTECGVPWTTLRAAQFHDLALVVVRALAKLPVMRVPPIRLQSVESAEVADRLVELALGEPAGRVPDMVGPEVLGLRDMVEDYLRTTGKRRARVNLPFPGKLGRLYREGDNLVTDGAIQGRRTWSEFLDEAVGGRR